MGESFAPMARFLLSTCGLSSAELITSIAKQFASLPRARVGGIEYYHDKAGRVFGADAVVGTPSEQPNERRHARLHAQGGRKTFTPYFTGWMEEHQQRLFDLVAGDLWIEASHEGDAPACLLRRTERQLPDELWREFIWAVLGSLQLNEEVKTLPSALLSRVGMVGWMPRRSEQSQLSFRMLWTDRSLEQVGDVSSKELFELLGANDLEEYCIDQLGDYRWNLAINLSANAVEVSGLEVYPNDASNEAEWQRLAEFASDRCGWREPPDEFLHSWFRRWPADELISVGPSHLVGNLAVALHKGEDPRFVVSPSHIKLTPCVSGEWSAKSYLRFECHA